MKLYIHSCTRAFSVCLSYFLLWCSCAVAQVHYPATINTSAACYLCNWPTSVQLIFGPVIAVLAILWNWRASTVNWLNMLQTLGRSLRVCWDLDDWSLCSSWDIPDLDLALEIVSGRQNFPVCGVHVHRALTLGNVRFLFQPAAFLLCAVGKKASIMWLKIKPRLRSVSKRSINSCVAFIEHAFITSI